MTTPQHVINSKEQNKIIYNLRKLIKKHPEASQQKLCKLSGYSTTTVNKYIKAHDLGYVMKQGPRVMTSMLRAEEIESRINTILLKNPFISVVEIRSQTGYSDSAIKKYFYIFRKEFFVKHLSKLKGAK
jgi:biotin operon repressor